MKRLEALLSIMTGCVTLIAIAFLMTDCNKSVEREVTKRQFIAGTNVLGKAYPGL